MPRWQIPANTSTRRFINFVIALAFALLVVWVFVMSRTDMSGRSGDSEEVTVEQQQRLDSLRKALGKDVVPAEKSQQNDESSWLGRVFPVLIFFAIVLAGLWWWSRKSSESDSELFKEVAQQQIAPGQTIKIMEFNGKYWVLGVTGQNINLLQIMEKEEWSPDTANLSYSNNSSPKGQTGTSFAQLFNAFKQKGDSS